MSAAPALRATEAAYLALDAASPGQKFAFNDGYVFDMARGTKEHALITANLTALLHTALRGGPCTVYTSDLRVRTAHGRGYSYPDVTVSCGEEAFFDGDTLESPTAVFEVLSASTEGYDRGDKFRQMRTADTLRAYVLLSQYAPVAEAYERETDGTWKYRVAEGLDAVLDLRTLGVAVPLAEVYAKVAFKPDPNAGAGTFLDDP